MRSGTWLLVLPVLALVGCGRCGIRMSPHTFVETPPTIYSAQASRVVLASGSEVAPATSAAWTAGVIQISAPAVNAAPVHIAADAGIDAGDATLPTWVSSNLTTLGEVHGVTDLIATGPVGVHAALDVVLCASLDERLLDGLCVDAGGSAHAPETFSVDAVFTWNDGTTTVHIDADRLALDGTATIPPGVEVTECD